MGELHRAARLALHRSVGEWMILKVGAKDLDGHERVAILGLLAEGIAGLPDLPHRALADGLDQRVAIAEPIALAKRGRCPLGGTAVTPAGSRARNRGRRRGRCRRRGRGRISVGGPRGTRNRSTVTHRSPVTLGRLRTQAGRLILRDLRTHASPLVHRTLRLRSERAHPGALLSSVISAVRHCGSPAMSTTTAVMLSEVPAAVAAVNSASAA